MRTLGQDFQGLPPQMVQQFLHLLEDVSRIQQVLLDETAFLRARLRDLEARTPPGPAPAGEEGRRP